MDADAAVRLMQKAVGVTRERRHQFDISAVTGNFLKFLKFLKLFIACHVLPHAFRLCRNIAASRVPARVLLTSRVLIYFSLSDFAKQKTKVTQEFFEK